MEYKKRKHNTPIATVIKNYLDKDGGKVTVSRNEIDKRFYALDWRYQKQILFAFLQSGKSDRLWAYRRLYVCWDDCFIPAIQKLWEQYHEIQLSWLVIDYFPTEYLKRNLEDLGKGRNYFFIFKRLYDDSDFILDRTRLNEADLLSAKHLLGEEIADGDVRDMFFMLMYKICKGYYELRADYGSESRLAIFDNSLLTTMLCTINEDLKRPYLVEEFKEWMDNVTKSFKEKYGDIDRFYHGKEYAELMMKNHCIVYIDYDYKEEWNTYDPKNQQQFLDYLSKMHKCHAAKEESEKKKKAELEHELLMNPVTRELIDMFDGEIKSFNFEEDEIKLPF